MQQAQVIRWIDRFRSMFDQLPEEPPIYELWQDLVTRHHVTGFAVYDTRLVAHMQFYKIDKLLTFNTRHFKRYPIQIIDPRAR